MANNEKLTKSVSFKNIELHEYSATSKYLIIYKNPISVYSQITFNRKHDTYLIINYTYFCCSQYFE